MPGFFVEKDKIQVLPLAILFIIYTGIVVLIFLLAPQLLFKIGVVAFGAMPYLIFITKYKRTKQIGKDPDVKPEAFLKNRKLPPALAGLLIDEWAGFEEIVATIIDLTYRKYIILHEGRDVVLERTAKNSDSLLDYEKKILDGLFGKESYQKRIAKGFSAKENMVKVSELDNIFAYNIPKINRSIYEESVRKGLFEEAPHITRMKYEATLTSIIVIAVVAVPLAWGASVKLFDFPDFARFFGILSYMILPPGIMSLVILFMLAEIAPRKTEYGTAEAASYLRTKEWLESHKLSNINMSTEFLEYITAFNIDETYLMKLEPLSIKLGKKDKPIPIRYSVEYDDSQANTTKLWIWKE